jgi:hypothetical protein
VCADSCSSTMHNALAIGRADVQLSGGEVLPEHCNISVQVRNEYEADEPVPLVNAEIAGAVNGSVLQPRAR